MPSANIATRGKLTKKEKGILAQDACDKFGYNPFEELIEIATKKETLSIKGELVEVHTASMDQRITIAKEVASFLAPKVKQENSTKGNVSFKISLVRFGENRALSNDESTIEVEHAD